MACTGLSLSSRWLWLVQEAGRRACGRRGERACGARCLAAGGQWRGMCCQPCAASHEPCAVSHVLSAMCVVSHVLSAMCRQPCAVSQVPSARCRQPGSQALSAGLRKLVSHVPSARCRQPGAVSQVPSARCRQPGAASQVLTQNVWAGALTRPTSATHCPGSLRR